VPDPQDTSAGTNEDLSGYAGRWIARLGRQIVGQGGTPEQALQAARAARFKENPEVIFVSSGQPLAFHPLLEKVRALIPSDIQAFLVGGAIRDAMLARPTHDLDFVLSKDAITLARKVADQLGAAFYPLDKERDYGRVILTTSPGHHLVLDFAAFQGADLESDLRARDFTINAMAVDVHSSPFLLDPLGGAADLRAKQLRACSPTSFSGDPVRILRGVRLASEFDFHIQRETRELMRLASSQLTRVSPERLRDELFRILESEQQVAALRALDILDALLVVLPELKEMKGVVQSPPHIHDVWNHSLEVVNKLAIVLDVLRQRRHPDAAASLHLGLLSLKLGRFRDPILAHLDTRLNTDRQLRPILLMAALYHDAGKPSTSSVDVDGSIRFFDHEKAGEQIAARRGKLLQLSNLEIDRLKTIVRHHMRPLLLVQTRRPPTRRAIYRFFRDTGAAGVDICLLSLADVFATYGHTLPQDIWTRHLDVVREFLEAWWEHPEESVSPVQLLTGSDLISEFGLKPGPIIGKILESLKEAQATGKISSRSEALDLAGELLAGTKKHDSPQI
jgi:tRNA nucleotidyltransferase/poly(A) polymerase